jgi:hypothetical protein
LITDIEAPYFDDFDDLSDEDGKEKKLLPQQRGGVANDAA